MYNVTCYCFLVVLQYYFIGPDIAFNKPAYASSVHAGNWNYYGPQLVNNGKADCAHSAGPIAHTQSDYNPWFKVDLLGIFKIETVAVLPRASKFYNSLLKTLCFRDDCEKHLWM